MSEEIRVKTLGGRCGCIFCKTGSIGPNSRAGWAGQRNKRGSSFVGKKSRKGKSK